MGAGEFLSSAVIVRLIVANKISNFWQMQTSIYTMDKRQEPTA